MYFDPFTPQLKSTKMPWFCNECKQEFKNQKARHMRERHGEVGKLYHCPIEGCEKVFKRKDVLQDHIRRPKTHAHLKDGAEPGAVDEEEEEEEDDTGTASGTASAANTPSKKKTARFLPFVYTVEYSYRGCYNLEADVNTCFDNDCLLRDLQLPQGHCVLAVLQSEEEARRCAAKFLSKGFNLAVTAQDLKDKESANGKFKFFLPTNRPGEVAAMIAGKIPFPPEHSADYVHPVYQEETDCHCSADMKKSCLCKYKHALNASMNYIVNVAIRKLPLGRVPTPEEDPADLAVFNVGQEQAD